MPDSSARLSLPFLMPSQAQKHVTHNTALERLDVLVQPQVLDLAATIPPDPPGAGATYVLGLGATNAWAGKDGMLASWNDNAWLFLQPQEGWQVLLLPEARLYVLVADIWQPVAAATQNLDGIGIGTASDDINRLAVAAPATLLTHDGAGHQIKVNKASATDTASLLYQSGYSGRAEMGLAGSDDWSVKVSAEGTTWTTALRIDAASGAVGIGPDAQTDYTLSVAAQTVEPTILVRNAGGIGGAAFRMIDDLSGGDWKFKTTNDGSFKLRNQTDAVDHLSLDKTTRRTDFAGAVRPASYTVTTLPSAAAVGAGAIIYVSDASGGAVMAFCDGSTWRRMTDRAVVS
ncbi:DUF2793 domain-containing protein [Puniceibacterium sp. IMCC21224]|uniref:DUF2793 domain-containing protein n=1 Tax=Puniceibacterium sp. IMCC21224 TaxID=1618204 RepID=UPI00065CF1F8|nr:DUF2793 domain-containing protein [Puniceibacterium sp. IMCC21224]KMK63968.1 Protein of unknown function (DUF2793) [Puniceibacterium sp. IMCC21224]